MKTKTAGWIVVGATAVFLVFCIGYFFGAQGKSPVVRIPAEQATGYEQRQPDTESTVPVVNINTAAAEEFDMLPGIGAITAARIVAYRESVGSFETIWQLLAVEGIGDKTMEALEPFLTLS